MPATYDYTELRDRITYEALAYQATLTKSGTVSRRVRK